MAKHSAAVPKTFDDQFEAFVGFIKQKNWNLTGVDLKALDADLKAQREDKQKDMDLARQAEAF